MALRNLKGIKELRFVLCQTSSASEGLRNYIANNYKAIRQSPATITVRQNQNSLPLAIATYSYGIEKKVNLKKLSETEIESIIAELEAHSAKIAQEIKL